MGKQNHIIRKLIIEIGLPTREEAFNIQNRLTDEYKRIILDIIEEILDRLIGKEEVIRVDKLEIDLGDISQMHLSEDISRKVKREMEETLTRLIHEVADAGGNEAVIRMTTSTGTSFTVNATKQQSSRSDLETLVYFLEYGVFPWNNERKEKPSLPQMMAQAMEKNPDQLRQVLHNAVDKNYIFRRLALQLPEAQLYYLAAILGCDFSSQLSELSRQIQRQISAFLEINKDRLSGQISFTAKKLELRLLEETLIYFASGASRTSPLSSDPGDHVVNYIFRILEELLADARITNKTVLLNSYPGKPGSKSKTTNATAGKVVAQIHMAFGYFVEKRKQQSAESSSEIIAEKERHPAIISEARRSPVSENIPANKSIAKKDRNQPILPEAEEGIYVDNAGLIILHPYLPAFFKNLELIEGKSFVNDEAKFKAIHILQWLTYGDEKNSEYVEHELVLNKLLCAVPVSEPVPVSMILSEKEKENAMILLNAVITNWPIMKNSSVHALRTTFLQKEGKLMYGDNNWNLLIARDSAVEVLIDRLPWSISMVKLPWNDYTIYSTW